MPAAICGQTNGVLLAVTEPMGAQPRCRSTGRLALRRSVPQRRGCGKRCSHTVTWSRARQPRARAETPSHVGRGRRSDRDASPDPLLCPRSSPAAARGRCARAETTPRPSRVADRCQRARHGRGARRPYPHFIGTSHPTVDLRLLTACGRRAWRRATADPRERRTPSPPHEAGPIRIGGRQGEPEHESPGRGRDRMRPDGAGAADERGRGRTERAPRRALPRALLAPLRSLARPKSGCPAVAMRLDGLDGMGG